MDERKRPATYDNEDVGPPLKRQATATVNGSSKSHQDADMPGKDELERFQKDAILRQMHEYKREKITLESQYNDLKKRAAYHDDHLRVVDAWFAQLLDEITLLAGDLQDRSLYSGFPSALLPIDTPTFEKHLKSRSSAISSAIRKIFSKDRSTNSEASDLQGRIAKLLLAEKGHVNELEKIRLEKEQMEERLETASMRYMVAEKKLDRAKSTTVAKLERQAIAGGRSETGSGLGGGMDGAGKGDQASAQVDGESLAEAERAKKEAIAVSAKQAEQLEKLALENQKLFAQVTEYRVKQSSLSDEDYSHTDLFKQLKKQHEDVVTKLNGLEATNAELKQETKRLLSERSSYRMQLDAETQASITEKELQLTKAESDLARIRTARDELQADVAMRKAVQEQERASVNQLKELVAIKDAQISTLEAEAERLNSSKSHNISTDLDNLSIEELRSKYLSLDDNNSMLKKEITTMMERFTKMSVNVSHKLSNTSEMEEKVLRLGAEKAKADQKYFAAMKAKEAREQEIRTLRTQNSKSSDIISQLKEAEASTRALVANLEKYVAESKDALASVESKRHAVQTQVSEKELAIDGLKKQIEELKSLTVTRDSAYSTNSSAQRKVEVEVERMKVELAEKDKKLETWRAKGLGSENEHYEALRGLVICSVCRKNFKDTVIKTCGHVLCKDCVEERLQSRMRKCPNCNKAFGANDHMRITL